MFYQAKFNNAAAESHVDRSNKSPSDFVSNIVGTFNLLEATEDI